MSHQSSQDKTERATPKREREAREQGQLARSRELTTAVLIAGGAAVLWGYGADMVAQAETLLRDSFEFRARDLATAQDMPRAFLELLRAGLLVVAPILLLGFLGALVAPLLLGGWNFSAKAMAPKFSRLDPVAGLGRIFSSRALVDLGLGLFKVVVLGGIGAAVLWSSRSELPVMAAMEVRSGIADSGAIVFGLLGWLALGLAVIAALDVPWQLFRHGKDMRMTKQEVREEYKQAEGRPEVKAKIRQAQQALAQRRMMDAVPGADVIVTNPTHYAVALKYSAGRMRAPKLVAKGADVIASNIRELAREHRIPVVSAPPLARALYRSVELDQEIPAALFQAVAQVLSYVFQLRRWTGATPPPAPPQVGDVPGGEPDDAHVQP
ncbi:flagellar biosynthesis protein FlhB [Panacagrimonas sp.]|uniref:flagellar biosynthesis protein FlhB n=1 Tax=Panacagrimonas sp. TaxID=2480088 RepID=UPI003B5166CA